MRPGMAVRIEVVVDHFKDVLTLPLSVIQTDNGESFVWVKQMADRQAVHQAGAGQRGRRRGQGRTGGGRGGRQCAGCRVTDSGTSRRGIRPGPHPGEPPGNHESERESVS